MQKTSLFEFLTEAIPSFYKYSETRPISDGFKKNNVNYWVFRDLCSIILHS